MTRTGISDAKLVALCLYRLVSHFSLSPPAPHEFAFPGVGSPALASPTLVFPASSPAPAPASAGLLQPPIRTIASPSRISRKFPLLSCPLFLLQLLHLLFPISCGSPSPDPAVFRHISSSLDAPVLACYAIPSAPQRLASVALVQLFFQRPSLCRIIRLHTLFPNTRHLFLLLGDHPLNFFVMHRPGRGHLETLALPQESAEERKKEWCNTSSLHSNTKQRCPRCSNVSSSRTICLL